MQSGSQYSGYELPNYPLRKPKLEDTIDIRHIQS